MRKNLIFGGHGQDGRLLSQNLISKNEKVLSVVNTTTILSQFRDILEHAMAYVGNSNSDFKNYLDLGLFRQVETAPLVGDATRMRKSLDWKASRSVFTVIEEMIENQIRNLGE